jgi:hypothetical protein
VAPVACMRKLLVMLNGRVRDQLAVAVIPRGQFLCSIGHRFSVPTCNAATGTVHSCPQDWPQATGGAGAQRS